MIANLLSRLTSGPRPIHLREMRRASPAALLTRSRRMACAVPVADDAVLCRVLTRYRLFVDAADVGFGVHVMLDGCWENWLTAFLARRVQPGMRVVDAGANHGYYTLLFAHLAGERGRIAAVEPHPRTASLLAKSLYANGFQTRVELYPVALGDRDGFRLGLRHAPGEPKNAHLVETPATDDHVVDCMRLDTLLADWPRIDLIKADVEGAEESLIEGAWPLLERDRPQLILEFNASRCRKPEELLTRLKDLYGRVEVVGRDGRAHPADIARLSDRGRTDDVILYLSHADG